MEVGRIGGTTMAQGWYAFDLDGTLEVYTTWQGASHIGEPVMPMVERVNKLLSEGKIVKILTARVNPKDASAPVAKEAIAAWTKKVFGVELESTCEKDHGMVELYDDRAVAIKCNTGIPWLNPGRHWEVYK